MSNSNKPTEYLPFISDFKDETTKELKGHNFMAFLKSWFLFKSRIYKDLAIPQNGKTQSAKDYNFLLLPAQTSLIGIPAYSIKQNKQMSDTVNFYLKKDINLPIIQLSKPNSVKSSELLSEIEQAMVKTKEFYKNNPPLANQNQNIKVFETTVQKITDSQFLVNNLTTKFLDGIFNIDNKKYALIHFPFNTTKRILLPAENIKDNNNGSFNVVFDRSEYQTVSCNNVPECSAYKFYTNTNKLLKAYKKQVQKPTQPQSKTI